MKKIWLDVTTVLRWQRPAVGIVRVEAECAKHALGMRDGDIHFCHYDEANKIYCEVDRQELQASLNRIHGIGKADQVDKSAESTSNIPKVLNPILSKEDKVKERIIKLIKFLPNKPGQVIWRFAHPRRTALKTAAQAWRLAKQACREIKHTCNILFSMQKTCGQRQEEQSIHVFKAYEIKKNPPFRANDVYISMGLDWSQKDVAYLYSLKQEIGFNTLLFCHDIIPVRMPHMCCESATIQFKRYFADMARCADEVLCISEYTRRDLQKLLVELDVPLPTMSLVRLGCQLPTVKFDAPIATDVKPYLSQRYILFVSTIERRKNQEVLYRAYARLVEQGETNLPLLIFVGVAGWGVDNLLSDIRLDPRTQKYIKILNCVEDSDLVRLYQNAYFTVYPSLYEGWGLPVAESLAIGKFCLASNATSIPEVGGDFLEYIDPWDVPRWAERLQWYFDHPELVNDLSSRISREYEPYSWGETASHIISKAQHLAVK